MSSLFIGAADKIRMVYPDTVVQALQAEASLTDCVLDERSVKENTFPEVRVLFSTWGMPALTEEEIARAFPDLQAVFYAAGTVQYFARPFLARGIRVFSAWAANAVPVAEYAVSQILLANKGFFSTVWRQSGGDTRAARETAQHFPGNYGCRVGILGAGKIGALVIEELRRHELEVWVYDPFLPAEQALRWGVERVELPQLFAQCQTISNHLADNTETRGLLDYALFSRMKDNATFLNTGRGAQVVEEDLARALRERPEAAAVLDVTWPEPPEPGHPFYALPNVFLTPHIAGSLGGEVQRMAWYMLEDYRRWCRGESPRYEVTQSMLATMA